MTETFLPSPTALSRPAIILIEPQMGNNIGACARAMLNNGLTDLRLVRPRDGWPNPNANAMASGADCVLEQARVFETTAAAIADLDLVLATTARLRDMIKPILTPRQAALELHGRINQGGACGILFGPERSGLENDDVTLADAVINVPLNPNFSSLNLAQCVLLVAYEWFQADIDATEYELRMGKTRPACKAEILNLVRRLIEGLETQGFFTSPDNKPIMIRNIRNMFQRMNLTDQECRTCHGMISTLMGSKILPGQAADTL